MMETGSSFLFRMLEQSECQTMANRIADHDPWARMGYSAQTLAAYLARQDDNLERLVVCTPGGDDVGVAAIRQEWLRGPHLELICIFGEWQGRGAGSAVVDYLERSARAAGKANCWILVSDFNHKAREFYTRAGYGECCVLEDLARAGFNEILLRKRL